MSYHVMINGDICVFLLRRTIYRPPLSSLTYSKTNTSHTNSLNQRVPKSSKVISPSKAKHTHTHTEIIIIIMGNALPGNSTEYHRQKRPSVLKFERAVSRIKTPVTVIKKWHSGYYFEIFQKLFLFYRFVKKKIFSSRANHSW